MRSLLEREGYAILCAYNGRVAQQFIRQHQPSLLLLDQELPLVDGLELCRSLRGESDAPAVFIMSDHPDELNKLLAFSAGADDYLPLPMHPRELLGRMKVALRRSARLAGRAEATLRSGAIELHAEQRRAYAQGHELPLTTLEYELLAIFVRHPGRVFAREELLDRLSGFLRGAPLDRAVDIHVSNLRHKLREATDAEAPIDTVRGVGYRLRGATEDAAGVTPRQQEGGGEVSLERLALAALERAPMPLLVLSPDRTVLLYNDAAQRLCGWKAEEVAGQVKCYSLLGCHSGEGTLLCYGACPMRVALDNGLSDQQARYVITLKDGRELAVSAHYSRLNLAGMQSECMLLVLQPEGEHAAGRV